APSRRPALARSGRRQRRYLFAPQRSNEKSEWYKIGLELDRFSVLALQFSIIGADGARKASHVGSPPIDLRDREHFRVPARLARDELFINKPVLGCVAGGEDPAGHFQESTSAASERCCERSPQACAPCAVDGPAHMLAGSPRGRGA